MIWGRRKGRGIRRYGWDLSEGAGTGRHPFRNWRKERLNNRFEEGKKARGICLLSHGLIGGEERGRTENGSANPDKESEPHGCSCYLSKKNTCPKRGKSRHLRKERLGKRITGKHQTLFMEKRKGENTAGMKRLRGRPVKTQTERRSPRGHQR